MVSRFGKKRDEARPYSKDYFNAFSNYMDEMSFIKIKGDMIPIVEGLQAIAVADDKKGTLEFLNKWKDVNLLHKEIESGIPAPIEKAMKAMRILTHYMVMRFALKGPIFNALMAKYAQTYSQDSSKWLLGEKRMFKNKNKFWAIANKYNMSPFEPKDNPRTNFWELTETVSYYGYELGERMAHAVSGIAQIEDKVYDDWFDNEGNIVGKNEEEVKERENKLDTLIDRYKKKTTDIQGKYSADEKRGYLHTEMGKFVGQFKTWVPDVYGAHFKAHAIVRGEVVEGSITTLWRLLAAETRKDILSGKVFHGDTLEAVNMRKNLYELIVIASLLSLSLGGDDNDKKGKMYASWLNRMLGEIASVYNLENWKTLPLAGGVTTASTLLDVIIDAATWREYTSTTRYHKEGDLKLPSDIWKITPYRKLIKTPIDIIEGLSDDN